VSFVWALSGLTDFNFVSSRQTTHSLALLCRLNYSNQSRNRLRHHKYERALIVHKKKNPKRGGKNEKQEQSVQTKPRPIHLKNNLVCPSCFKIHGADYGIATT
jgi:hypothetical protein